MPRHHAEACNFESRQFSRNRINNGFKKKKNPCGCTVVTIKVFFASTGNFLGKVFMSQHYV